jgi:hypothetical protein
MSRELWVVDQEGALEKPFTQDKKVNMVDVLSIQE